MMYFSVCLTSFPLPPLPPHLPSPPPPLLLRHPAVFTPSPYDESHSASCISTGSGPLIKNANVPRRVFDARPPGAVPSRPRLARGLCNLASWAPPPGGSVCACVCASSCEASDSHNQSRPEDATRRSADPPQPALF